MISPIPRVHSFPRKLLEGMLQQNEGISQQRTYGSREERIQPRRGSPGISQEEWEVPRKPLAGGGKREGEPKLQKWINRKSMGA